MGCTGTNVWVDSKGLLALPWELHDNPEVLAWCEFVVNRLCETRMADKHEEQEHDEGRNDRAE